MTPDPLTADELAALEAEHTPREVREIQHVGERVETGAVEFTDDWPGLFVRGDDCIAMLCAIRVLRSKIDQGTLDSTMLGPILQLEPIIRRDVLGRP